MRNTLFLAGSAALLVLLGAGCAGPEQKLGRGLANTTEVIRLNEFNRALEQNMLFNGTDVGRTTGFVQGFDRTVARTGLGIYEVVTFPLPPYGPIWTNYLGARPEYPDNFQPRKWDEPVMDTDYALGFTGGDVAPWFPGSRFRVFDY